MTGENAELVVVLVSIFSYRVEVEYLLTFKIGFPFCELSFDILCSILFSFGIIFFSYA